MLSALKKYSGRIENGDNFSKKCLRFLFSRTRKHFAHIAYYICKLGMKLQITSKRMLVFINSNFADESTDYFLLNRNKLLQKIDEISRRQKKEYNHYSYFYDYPYQGFSILGIFGERSSEERFDLYKLGDYLSKSDSVLDLGCNCGFVSIYTSFRTGCKVKGIDINPYAIEIGNECAKYLKIENKVSLEARKVQDLTTDEKFNGVFSFATHWTDDKNYRVALVDHFKLIHNFLKKDGYLFFESHGADYGDEKFYETIDQIQQKLFTKVYSCDSDAGSRHYYIFQKK